MFDRVGADVARCGRVSRVYQMNGVFQFFRRYHKTCISMGEDLITNDRRINKTFIPLSKNANFTLSSDNKSVNIYEQLQEFSLMFFFGRIFISLSYNGIGITYCINDNIIHIKIE